MGTNDGLPPRSLYGSMSIEELARLKGVRPVTSLADMACDVFESDEEMEEFIAFTYTKDFHDLVDHEGLTLLTS